MSDAPIVNSVSEGFINEQRATIALLDAAVLANPGDTLSRDLAAVARHTLNTAISGTNYKEPAVTDTRTIAEKLYDRSFGIEPRRPTDFELPQRPAEGFGPDELIIGREFMAAMSLDPLVGSAILRDIAENGDPDPVEIKAHVERTGRKYDEELAYAQFALDRGNVKFDGGKIEAKDLSAHSLVMLAIQGRQLQKHAAGKVKP
jgi:hypothetical protein